MFDPVRVAELIRTHFPLEPVTSVPEIRLHRAAPGSGLWRFAETDSQFDTPYWAYGWGGGLALARHVLDHPESVASKRVLDLGCGGGIVAIAAALADAATVTAADVDRYAVVATEVNAAANGVTVTTMLDDLTAGEPPAVDVLLVGDLFYDAELATRVTAFLERCVAAGVEVLVGDPLRAFLPREKLRLLAEYPGGDFGNGDAAKLNAVFAFRTNETDGG